LAKTPTKHLLYGILRPIVRLGARVFMRRLVITGLENFPKDKPVILISNHQNAMLDPVLICVFTPKQLHWLARADVFKNPFVKKILYRINMMPVYRERDGVDNIREENQRVFEECYRRLSKNAVVAMFPEGGHRGRKQLSPFKKGVARLSLGAMDFLADKDIVILPVGLDYSGYYDYHPEFYLEVGKPISLKPFYDKSKSDFNGAMNDIIAKGTEELQKLMIDIKEENSYDLIMQLRELVMSLAGDGSFKIQFKYYREFTKKATANDFVNKNQELIKNYYAINDKYRLDELENNVTASKQFLRLVLLGILLPVYLISRTFYLPIERFIEGFVKKNIKDLLFKNSIRMAFFTFLGPIYTIIVFSLLSLFLGWTFSTTLLIIASAMIGGRLAIAWLRIYHRWLKGIRWKQWSKGKSNDFEKWKQLRTDLLARISDLMK
jgi:1-acyl-sn-glycerol-3-phosphate acyltransferase